MDRSNWIDFEYSARFNQDRSSQPWWKKWKTKLFSELYIDTQLCDADIGEVFKHKTLSYQLSLSKNGLLWSGDKAELLPFLKNSIGNPDDLSSFPIVEGVVLEGSVVVNHLKPDHGSSFSTYAVDKVSSYVKRYQQKATALRIDVCYDTYIEKSLKGGKRDGRRRAGVFWKVNESSPVTSGLKGFVCWRKKKQRNFQVSIKNCSKTVQSFQLLMPASRHYHMKTSHCCVQQTTKKHTLVYLSMWMILDTKGSRVWYELWILMFWILLSASFRNFYIRSCWLTLHWGNSAVSCPFHEMVLDPARIAGSRFLMLLTGGD